MGHPAMDGHSGGGWYWENRQLLPQPTPSTGSGQALSDEAGKDGPREFIKGFMYGWYRAGMPAGQKRNVGRLGGGFEEGFDFGFGGRMGRVGWSRAIFSSTLPTLERFTPQSLLSSLRVGGRPLVLVRNSISARRASFLSARAAGRGFSVIGISTLRVRKTRRIELVLTSVVPQSWLSSARVGGRPRLSVSCLALAHRASSKELGTLLIAIADHASRKIVRPPWSGIAHVNLCSAAFEGTANIVLLKYRSYEPVVKRQGIPGKI